MASRVLRKLRGVVDFRFIGQAHWIVILAVDDNPDVVSRFLRVAKHLLQALLPVGREGKSLLFR